MTTYLFLRSLVDLCGGTYNLNAKSADLFNTICWQVASLYNRGAVKRLGRIAKG